MNCTEGVNCNHALNCTQSLLYNGDVAGVGVRLSFYFQNFILVLLVDRSYEDAESALWTFIATSFGLTIAALVQVGSQSLTLLEGILVSQLSWLANLGTFLALASYSRSKGEDSLVKFAAVFQGYLSMILTIVMWTYGYKMPPSNCNSAIKFVFLFAVEVPALGTGRVIALAFASLMMLVYTGVTFTECRAWRKHGTSRISKRDGGDHDLEVAQTADRPRRGSTSSARSTRHRRKGNMPQKRRADPSRQQWLGMDVDPIFFGIFLSQLIVFAYFILTTELIITRSKAIVSDSSQWGFGQVLALTVVIPALIALWRAIQKNRIAKLRKLEREKKEAETINSPTAGSISKLPLNPVLQLTPPSDGANRPSSTNGLAPTTARGGSSISSVSTT